MAGRLSRRRLAQYVADGLVIGEKQSVILHQLAAYLVENRRTSEIELVVRDIEYYLSDKGYVSTTVTSAFDLTAETKKAIEVFVKQKTAASQVSLAIHIDQSVIGGVKISLPGYEINQTVSHQLTVLKTRFKKV